MEMDNHLHTIFSDGQDSPRDMALAAIALEYKQITFTDHVRRDSDWIAEYLSEISVLKNEFHNKIIIKSGVEAKIINLNGDIDFDNQNRQKPDVVLAAMHRIPVGEEKYIRPTDITCSNINEIYECFEKANFKALENNNVDVLAHPFQLCSDKICKSFFTKEYCELLRNTVVKNSKYLEYNCSKYNQCVQQSYWIYPTLKVWFGSDSHSVNDMIKNSAILKAVDFS